MTNRKIKLSLLFPLTTVLIVVLSSFILTPKESDSDPKPEKLIQQMEKAMGGKANFYKLKDVQFNYTFEYIGSGKKDVSIEKYVFEGEQSWARYTTHESLVMPDKKGDVIHALIDGKPYIQYQEELIKDEKMLSSCKGIREANYYWFTMMYKLSDPGVMLTYKGQEKVVSEVYHKVKVDYDKELLGKENNDAYLLYINEKTHIVDHFYFAIPEDGSHLGVKIEVDYQTVEGVKVTAKRSAFMPDEKGTYSTSPRLVQTSSNFKFNNGLLAENLIPEKRNCSPHERRSINSEFIYRTFC